MESSRKEQKEALQVLKEFQDKFIANTEILIDELRNSKKEDTDKLLKSVTDAVNWEVGVLNGTMSFINENEELLGKEDINHSVMSLSEALQTGDDGKIADALEINLLPMLDKVKEAVDAVCD